MAAKVASVVVGEAIDPLPVIDVDVVVAVVNSLRKSLALIGLVVVIEDFLDALILPAIKTEIGTSYLSPLYS